MKKAVMMINVLLLSLCCHAQGWQAEWNISGNLLAGTGECLPFWQRTVEGGIMPYSSSGVVMAGGDFSYQGRRGWTFSAGTNLVGSLASRSPYNQTSVYGMVDRLYASASWKMLHIDAGLKPRLRELGDLSLTGGSIVHSGYSRNLPGVNAWSDWIYFEKGHWVGIRGNLAHYQMLDTRHVSDAYIHNKSLAIKFALGRKVDLEFCLDHWAQWGGASEALGERPASFKDYYRIFFAKQGGEDATLSDQQNALGNHLGREYIRLYWRYSAFDMTLQYDMPFEDGGQIIKTQNIPDGVYSLKFSFKDRDALVTDVLYEYVHTTWQSGDTHDRPATEEEMTRDYDKYVYWQDPEHHYYGRIVEGGLDNYFNNGEYRSGWTYHGRTIGLPLLLPAAPNAEGVTMGIVNNRVRAHHFGIKGMFDTVPYRFRATYSSNWGRYSKSPAFESRPKQLSLALEVELGEQVTDMPMAVAVGAYADFGKLYKNSAGLTLRMFWRGSHSW